MEGVFYITACIGFESVARLALCVCVCVCSFTEPCFPGLDIPQSCSEVGRKRWQADDGDKN